MDGGVSLLDELIRIAPPFPILGGEAGRRGVMMFIRNDGTIDPEKCLEYRLARDEYDAQFAACREFWTSAGKAARGE